MFLLKKSTLLVLLTLSFIFIGCKTADNNNQDDLNQIIENLEYLESTDSLTGDWQSSFGEHFLITKNTIDTHGDGYLSYAGNNLCLQRFDESSGIFYFQLTRTVDSNGNYTENAPDCGKWYTIFYKDFSQSGESIKFSAAFKQNGLSATESLEQAVSEFTVENGYYSWFSECTK